ncbi:hypothetical protein GCM10010372_45070 [Streptomyces tauricus]|nr:hypothetical protein GCM10010372_45070 [Streptomyces tauricus]
MLRAGTLWLAAQFPAPLIGVLPVARCGRVWVARTNKAAPASLGARGTAWPASTARTHKATPTP